MRYQGDPICYRDNEPEGVTLVAPTYELDMPKWVNILEQSKWAVEDGFRQGGLDNFARNVFADPASMVFGAYDHREWSGLVFLSHIRVGQDAMLNGYAHRYGARRTIERAVEAVTLLTWWAVNELKLKVIRIDFAEPNKSVKVVAELAGYKFAGYHSAHRVYDGQHIATVVYERLRAD